MHAHSAFADINWRQCEGTRIRIFSIEHPFSRDLVRHLDEFEEKTGIQARIEILPEDVFRLTRFQQLDMGQDIDGFTIMPGVSKLPYWELGWLMPLNDFINNPLLTSADWDMEDFFLPAMQGASINGQQIGIPINIETSLLAYRKDLFTTFKMPVPTSMSDLEVAAGFFHGQVLNGMEMIGLTMRGAGASASSQWVDFLYNFGGSWTNGRGKSKISAPESMAALRVYGNLLRKYGPPDAVRIGWVESTALFLEGRAAMIYDSNMFLSLYEDPERSKVAGKIGYTLLPGGPARQQPHVSSWCLSISGISPEARQKATWLFIQWATGKKYSLSALLQGIPTARASAWKSAEYQRSDRFPDWSAASIQSFEQGQPLWNPPVLQVQKIRNIVGQALIKAIQGEQIKEIAEEAMTLWMKQINHDD